MPYVVLTDLPADIPPDFICQALDDNNDGQPDAGLWDLIAGQVSDEIDSFLGLRYAVPIPVLAATGNYPAIVLNAGRTLAAEKLYSRRGQTDDKNPWSTRAQSIRATLRSIAKGDLPLDPTENRKDPSASVVTQPLQTVGRGTRMAF